MAYSHCSGAGQVKGIEMGEMGWEMGEPGPIVSYCADSFPCTCSGPVKCKQAINMRMRTLPYNSTIPLQTFYVSNLLLPPPFGRKVLFCQVCVCPHPMPTPMHPLHSLIEGYPSQVRMGIPPIGTWWGTPSPLGLDGVPPVRTGWGYPNGTRWGTSSPPPDK